MKEHVAAENPADSADHPVNPAFGAVPDADLLYEIRSLAVRVDVSMARLLDLVGEVDARGAWGGPGVKSCAHWLSWRCGVGAVTARTHVRVARALRQLPLVRAEFGAGRLSYAKVRALTRIADSDCENDLVKLAHAGTAAQVERTVREWRRLDDLSAAEEEARRDCSSHWDDDGMLVFRARMGPEEGALFLMALKAVRLGTAIPRDRSTPSTGEVPIAGDGGPMPGEQRVIDEPPAADGASDMDQPLAKDGPVTLDALMGLARAFLDPNGDIDADPQVQMVVHVDAGVLAEDVRGGIAHYAHGSAMSVAAARRLACDAALLVLLHADGDDVLDVGAPTRRVGVAMKRALFARDGGCIFPSCTERRPSRLHAHHVWHWADGGPTVLTNLVTLCRFHHRCVHHDNYGVEFSLSSARFIFTDPQGRHLPANPGPGITPDRADAVGPPVPDLDDIPQWHGEPLELNYVLDVLRHRRDRRARAREELVLAHAA